MPEPVVDVSSYQGIVNWQAEKAAGVVMGIAKASEGTNWNDPNFVANWRGIKAAGMFRGAYHFGHPGDYTGSDVDHFLSRISGGGGYEDGDRLWLDIEASDGIPIAARWALSFMSILSSHINPAHCGIYTGKWFIDANGGPSAWAPCTRWGLWMSGYTTHLPDCSPWPSCVLWQNTSSDRHPGVNGVCDGSIIENGGYFTATNNGKPTQNGGPPVPAQDVGAAIFRTNSGKGYWVVDADGGVFTFGDAQFYGSVPGLLKPGQTLAAPIVGMAPTSDDRGYWLVAADGGVFNFGNARFFGGLGGKRLNGPICGITAQPKDDGYILVAQDRGVFTFGSANYYGHPGA